VKLLSRSPAETESVGYNVGKVLTAGMVVKLYGNLGAGKTTMVRGIARAFGIPRESVVSPSFTIITEYESTPRFLHIDLYRIRGSSDLESTGIWDAIGDDAVAIVEWPEHAGDQVSDDEREITIEGINEENWHNL